MIRSVWNIYTRYTFLLACPELRVREGEREREERENGGLELWQSLHCVCSVGIITKYRFEVFRVFVLRRAKSPVETINLAL